MACLNVRDSNIENMFKNEESKDLVMKFEDGENMKVHSFLLIAMSPVFKSLIGSSKVVDIDDDKKAFKQMVKFLYIPKIPEIEETDNNHEDLMKLAHKYKVNVLHETIAELLSNKLSDKNALDIAILAKTYNAEDLFETSIKYVLENIGHTLNEGWEKKIELYPKIALKILKVLKETALTVYEFNGLDDESEIYGMQIPKTAAIKFNCNESCRLLAIGLYGHERSEMVYEAKITVTNGIDGVLHEETRQYLSEEDKTVIMVKLSENIKIKRNETYEVSAEVSGAMYYEMDFFNFLQDIHHEDTSLTVSISPSEMTDSHEIPVLYFSK